MSTRQVKANGSDLPTPSKIKSSGDDVEALKADINALRDDLTSLITTVKSIAQGKATDGAEAGKQALSDLGDKATDTKTYVEEKVRQNPLAAIGIALGAGAVIASLRRG